MALPAHLLVPALYARELLHVATADEIHREHERGTARRLGALHQLARHRPRGTVIQLEPHGLAARGVDLLHGGGGHGRQHLQLILRPRRTRGGDLTQRVVCAVTGDGTQEHRCVVAPARRASRRRRRDSRRSGGACAPGKRRSRRDSRRSVAPSSPPVDSHAQCHAATFAFAAASKSNTLRARAADAMSSASADAPLSSGERGRQQRAGQQPLHHAATLDDRGQRCAPGAAHSKLRASSVLPLPR